MATYLIGDVQGCYYELQKLLNKVVFNEKQDRLWFCGDLVNRGPRSLEVLRFISQLGEQHFSVLGNHDLHLLAVAEGCIDKKPGDTLDEILNAPDRDELLSWLRRQPLAHFDKSNNLLLVHAGVAPQWDIHLTLKLANEVEKIIRSDNWHNLLNHMYGDQPDHWNPVLSGYDRWRFIINCFTRIRAVSKEGHLNLSFKKTLADLPPDLIPWFAFPGRATEQIYIAFGHWAALLGKTQKANVFALDTGCVWGKALTALRLEDWQKFSVSAGLNI